MAQPSEQNSELPAAAAPATPLPPPRPGLSYTAPAPILAVPPTPGSIHAAWSFWLLSFVAGLAVLIGSFASRDSHLERLRSVVTQMAPGGDADAVGASAGIVFWGSLGALLLMLLLESAALAAVSARRGWARWPLVPLVASHVLVLVVAAAFLVPEGAAGSYVVMLWGAQVLTASVGLVLLFAPASNDWLQAESGSGA